MLKVAAHIGKGPHQTGAQCDPKGIKSGLAGKVRRQIHVLLNGIVHGVIEGPPRHSGISSAGIRNSVAGAPINQARNSAYNAAKAAAVRVGSRIPDQIEAAAR